MLAPQEHLDEGCHTDHITATVLLDGVESPILLGLERVVTWLVHNTDALTRGNGRDKQRAGQLANLEVLRKSLEAMLDSGQIYGL